MPLAALFEHEIAERGQQRIARHLREAGLPAGKTLESFDFTAAASLSKAHVLARAEGDTGWPRVTTFCCSDRPA